MLLFMLMGLIGLIDCLNSSHFVLAKFPSKSCEKAWASISPEQLAFNPELDSISGPDPTQSYIQYKKRLAKNLGVIRKNCYKTWTTLIFASITPDLVPDVYLDMLEMESNQPIDGIPIDGPSVNGSSLRQDVIVHFESDQARTNYQYHMFQSPVGSTALFATKDRKTVQRSDIQSPIIAQFVPRTTETEIIRFKNFLKQQIEEYPAENYFIIIEGHGSGFGQKEGQSGGLGIHSNDRIDLPGLSDVLSDIKEQRGGVPIELFALDACLFQELTDLTQISRGVQRCVAAPGKQRMAGFPYASIFRHLNSGQKFAGAPAHFKRSEGEPTYTAWMVTELYGQSYAPGGSAAQLDPLGCKYLTCSAVNTIHCERSLIPNLDVLGQSLLSFIYENPSDTLQRSIAVNQVIKNGRFFTGGEGTQDLGRFLFLLKGLILQHYSSSTALLQAIQDTQDALDDSVIHKTMGTAYSDEGMGGIAIWLPADLTTYQKRISDYSSSCLFQKIATSWHRLIKALYEP
jgi:hypothetical protein